MDRATYREQAQTVNSVSALVIRHCGGLYFAGFGGKPVLPKVKWASSLADAKMFNATAQSQAEKYIERIKAKDALYIGLHIIEVRIKE